MTFSFLLASHKAWLKFINTNWFLSVFIIASPISIWCHVYWFIIWAWIPKYCITNAWLSSEASFWEELFELNPTTFKCRDCLPLFVLAIISRMPANKLDVSGSITHLTFLYEVCLSTTTLHVYFLNHVEVNSFIMNTIATCALYREVPVSLHWNVDWG